MNQIIIEVSLCVTTCIAAMLLIMAGFEIVNIYKLEKEILQIEKEKQLTKLKKFLKGQDDEN